MPVAVSEMNGGSRHVIVKADVPPRSAACAGRSQFATDVERRPVGPDQLQLPPDANRSSRVRRTDRSPARNRGAGRAGRGLWPIDRVVARLAKRVDATRSERLQEPQAQAARDRRAASRRARRRGRLVRRGAIFTEQRPTARRPPSRTITDRTTDATPTRANR
jgi:hypothetical protein